MKVLFSVKGAGYEREIKILDDRPGQAFNGFEDSFHRSSSKKLRFFERFLPNPWPALVIYEVVSLIIFNRFFTLRNEQHFSEVLENVFLFDGSGRNVKRMKTVRTPECVMVKSEQDCGCGETSAEVRLLQTQHTKLILFVANDVFF